MKLTWDRYSRDFLDIALKRRHCLYVLHHPKHGDRPYYIGKAKNLGSRYKNNRHMLEAMLECGYFLYISLLGEENFFMANCYEQELIDRWKPISKQKLYSLDRVDVTTEVPWHLTWGLLPKDF